MLSNLQEHPYPHPALYSYSSAPGSLTVCSLDLSSVASFSSWKSGISALLLSLEGSKEKAMLGAQEADEEVRSSEPIHWAQLLCLVGFGREFRV